jgi:hypothetical protein
VIPFFCESETLVIIESETDEDEGVNVSEYSIVTITFKQVRAAQLTVFLS